VLPAGSAACLSFVVGLITEPGSSNGIARNAHVLFSCGEACVIIVLFVVTIQHRISVHWLLRGLYLYIGYFGACICITGLMESLNEVSHLILLPR